MIKFFRHIRKSLLEQNKMGKYFKYAIGEILLVVVGILIALQINNWNQKRLEVQKEKVVLNQLKLDFEANDSIIKKGLEYFDTRFKYNTLILKYTGPNVALPKDEKTRDSLGALNYPKVNLVNSTLNISSQQFDILGNESLKILLSKFPSIYAGYLEVQEEVKKLTIKQRVHYKKYVPIIIFDKDFEQENFKSNMLSVYRDRDFQNTTVDKRWNLKDALRILKRIDKENNLILELIKTELNDD
ncbi:DUF6090 family protein [Ichthyenterobacterium sp. W332]|uniref:DUF6090 family protein n=1 Tax=Microcosmobacter mediterraneus TaxID=3075607 RepID=A0ABU2YJA8_9FLAO|nr:DUF6090 family protein [Ichthyenterobacterium sp. W332]MDT0557897.1 DUF6090 family protein [Ichthyenterobacterium sp. W332]